MQRLQRVISANVPQGIAGLVAVNFLLIDKAINTVSSVKNELRAQGSFAVV